jgi:hypothetical protein
MEKAIITTALTDSKPTKEMRANCANWLANKETACTDQLMKKGKGESTSLLVEVVIILDPHL